MIEEISAWLPFYGAWVVVCTLLSLMIARNKGMKPLLPAAAGFVAAMIPVVGVIYLIILATREER